MSPTFHIPTEEDRARDSVRDALSPAHLARLHKQQANLPELLTESDQDLIELFARAGAGGTY